MSLFKRFKAWLRSIIAEEVAKISVSLTKERSEAIATLKNIENEISRSLKSEIASFEQRTKATLDVLHDEFEMRLRESREHIGNGSPSNWTADVETLASDSALKVKK